MVKIEPIKNSKKFAKLGYISKFVRFQIILLSLLLSILLPFTFLSFTPIYILRYLTSLMKRLLRPDLGKLLTAFSCLFATDKRYILVVTLTLDGDLDLQTLRQGFRVNVLRNGKNESCLHPELLQYPTTWLGFSVWAPMPNFHLEEHIKHYEGPVTFDLFTDSVSKAIQGDLASRPFDYGKSPWEIYLFNNCHVESDLDLDLPKSVLMLRIHHCLADGFSIYKLLSKIGNFNLEKSKPRPSSSNKQNLVSKLFKKVTFPFRIPYDLAKTLVLHFEPYGPWNLPSGKLQLASNFDISRQIPLSLIKKIRDQYQTTTTAVILTAVCGGLRKIMLESGKGVPDSIILLTPLPLAGHPDKLRNHFEAMGMRLPVGTENPVNRLRFIDYEDNSIRNSTFPWAYRMILKGTGGLYPPMIKYLFRSRGVTMLLSNFAGVQSGTNFLNVPIADLVFGGGPCQIGMASATISCNENLRILLRIDEGILPNAEFYVKRFMEYAVTEFDLLLDDGIV